MSQPQQQVANSHSATTKSLVVKGFSANQLVQTLRSSWQQVEHLELDLRGDYKVSVPIISSEIESFFKLKNLPVIKHLVLCGSCHDDTVLRVVFQGPVIEQLQSIEFSAEKLGLEMRQWLCEQASRCPNLQLFPHANELSDPRMLLLRAQIARDFGQLPRAIELLDRAVEQGGNHIHLHEKANMQWRQGNYQQALDTVEQALLRDPYFFPSLCLKISLLRNLGQIEQALSIAKQTRRRVHKEEHRLQTVAISMEILQQAGRCNEMEEEAMWGLADMDEDDEEEPSGQVFYWVAVIHAMVHNLESALGKLRQAIEKEPKLRKRAKHEPAFQSLATDERFAQLVQLPPPGGQ